MPSTPTKKKTDAILVLIDVVEYTPQAVAVSSSTTLEFDEYFAAEVTKRAKEHEFYFIKSIGDAALLWGTDPDALVDFAHDLFVKDRIPPYKSFEVRLRMIASKQYYMFSWHTDGRVKDVHGWEAIKIFRSEKMAHINYVLTFPYLYGGMEDRAAELGFHCEEITGFDDFKGMPWKTPPSLHLLRPPIPAAIADRELPDAYKQARELLRVKVSKIPVFGHLYPPISMDEDFLELGLDHGVPGGDQMATLTNSAAFAKNSAVHGELDDGERRSSGAITPRVLFKRVRKAIIVGLPGAGKTTILRHFAHEALKENPYAYILFVEASTVSRDAIVRQRIASNTDVDDILRVLTCVFLYPDECKGDGKTPARQFTKDEEKGIADTHKAMLSAWKGKQLIVLIDALDEAQRNAPDEHGLEPREWLRVAALTLRNNITPEPATEPPVPLPPRACFISSRPHEFDSTDLRDEPVYSVKPLTEVQIHILARKRLGDDTPLFLQFINTLPARADLQAIMGTPLTAMLMIFYFHHLTRFSTRYQIYRVLTLFVLVRTWERVKAGTLGALNATLSDFWQKVDDDAFLARLSANQIDPSPVPKQFQLLGRFAAELLYLGNNHATDLGTRSFSQDQFVNAMSRFGCDESIARKWLNEWHHENFVLHTGGKRYVPLHSTVFEYLAGEYLLSCIQNPAVPQQHELTAALENRERDGLDALPIICSRDSDTARKVLARLESASSKHTSAFARESTLPLRCLAASESYEALYLSGLEIPADITFHTAKFNAPEGKAWAYNHLENWFIRPLDPSLPETAAKVNAELDWLKARTKDAARGLRLSRSYFLEEALGWWKFKGDALTVAQSDLLRSMLSADVIRENGMRFVFLNTSRVVLGTASGATSLKSIHAATDDSFPLLARFQSPAFMERYAREHEDTHPIYHSNSYGTRTPQLLGLDVAGHGWDNHLAYWRTQVGEVVSGFAREDLEKMDAQRMAERRAFGGRVNVVGFLGSPNFRVGNIPLALAYSPDGAVAVSGDYGGTLVVWDAATGRELRRWRDGDGAIGCVAVSAGGEVIVSGQYNGAVRIRPGAGGESRELESAGGKDIRVCAITPDGKCVVAVDYDGAVSVWRDGSGDSRKTAEGILGADGGPKPEIIASREWHAVGDRSRKTAKGNVAAPMKAPRALLLSPDGAHAVSGHEDGSVVQWSVAGEEAPVPRAKVESGFECMALAMDAQGGGWDGQTIVTGDEDGSLRVWRNGGEISNLAYVGASFECVATLSGHRNLVRSCAVSPRGAHVLSGGDDYTLRLWDVAKGTPLRAPAGHENSLSSCAVSPDGTRVVTASWDHTLRVWDAASGESLRTLAGHTDDVRGCVVTPDGRRVVSASWDNTLRVWEPESGTPLRTLSGHTDSVRSCAVSPDGKWIVSGSGDTTLRIWEPESGAVRHTLSGHTGLVYGCAVSPDGRWVASASGDKTVRLWDAERGMAAGTLAQHDSDVWCCAFSPDGRMVASGGDDGKVRVASALANGVSDFSRKTVEQRERGLSPASAVSERKPSRTSTALPTKVDDYVAGSSIQSVAYAAEGRVLLAGTEVGELHVLDAATAKRIGVLDAGSAIYGIAVDPENSWKIYLALFSGTCMVLELPKDL